MDVLVVLGRRLLDDGAMHEDLIKRCVDAFEYFQKHKPHKVLLSGGAPNKKAKRTEAQAMRDYLIKKGMPKEKIVIENQSNTTYQNAKFCAPILKELKAGKVVICTSPNHLTRLYFNPIRLFKRKVKFAQIEPFSYFET